MLLRSKVNSLYFIFVLVAPMIFFLLCLDEEDDEGEGRFLLDFHRKVYSKVNRLIMRNK